MTYGSSVIKQKGESQNACFKKNKASHICRKTNISYTLICIRTYEYYLRGQYPFTFMSKYCNHSGKKEPGKYSQTIYCLHYCTLYAMRFILNWETSATDNSDCIDKDLLDELRKLKPELDFSNIEEQFIQKLHLISDTLIAYNCFLKVYIIQKKVRLFDLINQKKNTLKSQLTSCVSHSHLLIVRRLNEMYKRRDYIPIDILVDCPVTHGHYDNYYFSASPKPAFIIHNKIQKKIRNADAKVSKIVPKETNQCHYCNLFFESKHRHWVKSVLNR